MSWLDAKIDNLDDNSKQAVKDVAKEGAELTEHHVRTRGISKPGRIDTGAMVDSVGWSVDDESNDSLEVSFGFKNGPAYTPFQELGTRAIAPMYALTDAADQMQEELEKRLGTAVRKS